MIQPSSVIRFALQTPFSYGGGDKRRQKYYTLHKTNQPPEPNPPTFHGWPGLGTTKRATRGGQARVAEIMGVRIGLTTTPKIRTGCATSHRRSFRMTNHKPGHTRSRPPSPSAQAGRQAKKIRLNARQSETKPRYPSGLDPRGEGKNSHPRQTLSISCISPVPSGDQRGRR